MRSTAVLVAGVAVLMAGAVALAVGIPLWSPSVTPARAPVPADPEPAVQDYADWLSWARGLGFEGTTTSTTTAARAAILALADAELSALNEALRFGQRAYDDRERDGEPAANSAMALASWLLAMADRTQVDRLHELVPRLEPGAGSASQWLRMTVDLDGLPEVGDIHQGTADDCWLLAGLGAMAIADPTVPLSRIRVNDNGTYTALLWLDGQEQEVTVSPYFPVTEDGSLVYARGSTRTEANWASVFEKAYAALPAFGSYARLAGGSMLAESRTTVAAAISAITGKPATTRPAREVSAAQLEEAIAGGAPVTATTFLTGLAPAAGDDDVPLVDRHVYVVGAVQDEEVVLHNPWGYDTAVAGPATVRIPMDDFQRRVLLVTFGAP